MRLPLCSLRRKLVPCGKRADAEVLRQRLAEIGKGRSRAEIDAGLDASAVQQQRHVLARMVGARRRRIVAVIGGDHEQIVVAQLRQQARQPRVEPLEVRGIAGDVVAMAVDRIEVDQVGEDQAACPASPSAPRTWSTPSASLLVGCDVGDARARRTGPRPCRPPPHAGRPRPGDRAAFRDRRHRVVVAVRRCAETIRAAR